jgi:hypothetical protein
MKKKGAMETEEIVKLLLAAILLITLVSVAVYLLAGKGGEMVSGIKDALRFG